MVHEAVRGKLGFDLLVLYSGSFAASADLGTRAAAEQALVLVAREWLHRYPQLTNQSSSFPA